MSKEINIVILWNIFCNALPQVISFLAGFFTAIFAQPIREMLFKPCLELSFNNTNDFISLTPESGRMEGKPAQFKAYYIRVKVTNNKNITAQNCKAYLVNIEKLNTESIFKSTIYCDSIPLAWSCQNIGEQYEGININKGVNQFVDIVTTRHLVTEGDIFYPKMQQPDNSDILYPQIKLLPFRYESIFKEKGTFRFTIQVTSANADPRNIRIVLVWNGKWDKFDVLQG
ncbi:MAG: hypothetical protein PHY88_00125 [Candidatus Omnitrophica bacterium]|nr:hypothetical protein [Candidatus Omnitrophota bacterium]